MSSPADASLPDNGAGTPILIGSPLGASPEDPPDAAEPEDADPDDADELDPALALLADEAADGLEPAGAEPALVPPPLLPQATAPRPRAITAPKTNVPRVKRAAIRRPSTGVRGAWVGLGYPGGSLAAQVDIAISMRFRNPMPSNHDPSAPILISAERVTGALDITAAVDVLDRSFASGMQVAAPPRTHLDLADGSLLTMPASGTGTGGSPVGGVKVVTIRAANPEIGAPTVQAIYLLFGGPALAPLALIDGPALTNLRTSAVSALATRHLAPAHARSLVIFGAGAQARAHLTALAAVRPLAEVTVVSRTAERAKDLVRLASGMGLSARAGGPDDVAGADLVCCCTTAAEPLFDGALLRPGTHVVAVGAYRPDTRELDETTVTRGRLVVEDRAVALAEAGELAIPVAAGRFDMADIAADLVELCRGTAVRRSERDITVFKSVGMAAEDLVVADAVYRAVVAGDRPSLP
jgi:ornithine cyclodeaminase